MEIKTKKLILSDLNVISEWRTMRFLEEKQSRRFAGFIAVWCLLLLFLALWIGYEQGESAKKAILQREQALASWFLQEGMEEGALAAAFQNEAGSEEGAAFLRKIGHTEETVWFWMPFTGENALRQTAVYAVCALAIGFLLSGGTFFFLYRREMLYEQAAAAVRRLSEGENASSALPCGETGALYRLFGQLEQITSVFQAKNAAVSESREFLKDIMSDISHQLKTPLAALRMYAEIMEEDAEDVQTVRLFAGKSLHSIQRMETLIQSLLKIMRMDAGSIRFEKQPCRAHELASFAVGDLAGRAEAEGKRIFLDGAEEAVLCCDFEWTAEALSNLVKNALEHTERGGEIRISWDGSPLVFRFFVADNGSGIPEEDSYHIFKRFYRGKNTNRLEGTGLGLPLVRAIAEGQGGSVSVWSIPGEGSRFCLSFPAAILTKS